MFPVGLLLIPVIQVLRASNGSGGGSPRKPGGGSLLHDLDAWTLLMLVLRGFVLTTALLDLVADPLEGVVACAGAAIVVWPMPLIRTVCRRLGAWRLATVLTRFVAPLVYLTEAAAGARLEGARVVRWSGRDVALARDWLSRGVRAPAVGGPVRQQLWAELELAAGNDAGARLIFQAMELDAGLGAAAIPRRWRVADAATRGAWAEVVRIGLDRPSRGLTAAAFAAAVARAEGIGRAPSRGALALYTILGWPPVAIGPWLRRAWFEPVPALPPLPAPIGDLLADAVARLTWLEALPPHRVAPDMLVAVADLWDRALADPALAARIGRRLAAAGARCAPEDVLADLGRVVDVALDDHVRRLVVPLTVADGRLGASLGRVWAERVIVVERLVDELRRRLAARRWDEGDVELLRWATFVDAWRRAELVGHPTDVLALFDRAWQPLCDWAARADTIALERTLAHMVFSWMRPRMPWDQDDERRKLIANNWLVTR